MTRLILASVLTLLVVSASGQEQIRMERTRFYEGQKLLKPREVLQRLEINPAAHAEFKKAKGNYDAAQVFGFIGGFMIGWPLGTAIGGGDPQWGLAAGGAAIVLATLPMNSAFKKRAQSALTIYNSDKPSAKSTPLSVHFSFGATSAGIVVRM